MHLCKRDVECARVYPAVHLEGAHCLAHLDLRRCLAEVLACLLPPSRRWAGLFAPVFEETATYFDLGCPYVVVACAFWPAAWLISLMCHVTPSRKIIVCLRVQLSPPAAFLRHRMTQEVDCCCCATRDVTAALYVALLLLLLPLLRAECLRAAKKLFFFVPAGFFLRVQKICRRRYMGSPNP